jgi:SAM-dependent methyltransferase
MSSSPQTAPPAQSDSRRAWDLLVLDHMKVQAWDRILFVECGDGWIAEECWRRAVRAYVRGLDRSGPHVEAARQLRQVPGKLEFDTWDGHSLPVSGGAFDRVMVVCAPVEAWDLQRLMHEIRRTLRPDGDAYVLHAVPEAAEVRRSLAVAGLTGLRELAVPDDRSVVFTHARASP